MMEHILATLPILKLVITQDQLVQAIALSSAKVRSQRLICCITHSIRHEKISCTFSHQSFYLFVLTLFLSLLGNSPPTDGQKDHS